MMFSINIRAGLSALLLCLCLAPIARAQTPIKEDFSGATTSNSWNFFNGACLTASTVSGNASPGTPNGCQSVLTGYYQTTSGSNKFETLVGGFNGTFPDPLTSGALRFTDGSIKSVGGYNQNGAIISDFTFPTGNGVNVTYKTYTYAGNNLCSGGQCDGADGISFFLMDGAADPNVGAYGGSLGYSCSNANPPYSGLTGAYLGLGLDEYGNFLNGNTAVVKKGVVPGWNGDNTASGLGKNTQTPQEFGLRGAGSISWIALHSKYPAQYPTGLIAALQQQAVQRTCATGMLWDYSSLTSGTQTTTAVLDYPMIPNTFVSLAATGITIANETATKRGQANSLTYRLLITPNGLLTLAYALNKGAWQSVIKKQDIKASNGALPASFRFGFAGSTGGGTNVHEIACFAAAPSDLAGSSTTANEKQSGKVESGLQAYFSYYNPTDWTGGLTAYNILDAAGIVSIASSANWDASCVLTGVGTGKCRKTGLSIPTLGQPWTAGSAPSGRTMLTSSAGTGVAFQWASLNSTQTTELNYSDLLGGPDGNGSLRLNYLRGDRSNEINSAGVGLFRPRDSVLADINGSSPSWIGPPSSPYSGSWADRLVGGTAAENSGQSYAAFVTSEQKRENLAFAGANDGFVHGFRAGSFDASGNYITAGLTPNDGAEVLAYMPALALDTINTSALQPTGCNSLDYTNVLYCHNFYVDVTPGFGDLYYSSAWHTWLVGGLGAGGAAIYALDVTDDKNFSEAAGNAKSTVIGDWTSATISCTGNAGCGSSLGWTYAAPQIRRLHNGKWGLIFGNGLNSASGDAGLFIGIVDTNGAITFRYLSTGWAAAHGGTATGVAANGIVAVSPADFDHDHITDYVYAGDIQGNIWRFDLTSGSVLSWGTPASPIFSTGGQPITTRVMITAVPVGSGQPDRVMISFGTGRKYPLSAISPTTYATGSQSIYGFWDANMSGAGTSWNSISGIHYATLASPPTLGPGNLTAQPVSLSSAVSGGIDFGTVLTICWTGSTKCSPASSNVSYGWSIALPNTSEQIIYNPQILSSAFTVNSTVPTVNATDTCSNQLDGGYTYAIDIATGGPVTSFFQNNPAKSQNYTGDANLAAVKTDATGTAFYVTTSENTGALIYQTTGDVGSATQVKLPPNTSFSRLTWTELR